MHTITTTSNPILIRTLSDWNNARMIPPSGPNQRFLFLHPDASILPTDATLLRDALDSLPAGAAVIARIFLHDHPHQILNGLFWQGTTDPLWHSSHLGESWFVEDKPLIEPTFGTGFGAVLMTQETAERVGFYDPRFATQLSDLDWLFRARRLGIPCFLVRNAHTYADPTLDLGQLGTRYAVVRDSLLLARTRGAFWPLQLCRLLSWLVGDVWRPFNLGLSSNSGTNLLRHLVWAFASYTRGLRRRVADAESTATLAAVRDFLLNRFDRRR